MSRQGYKCLGVMDIEGTDERERGEDQVAGSLTCCAQDFEWKSAVLPRFF